MRDSVRSAFLNYTTKFEGNTRYFYLDVLGLVTIGPGLLQDPNVSTLLRFTHKLSSTPAVDAEVRAEWARVKRMKAMQMLGGGAFAMGAQLFATPESIAAATDALLQHFDAALAATFSDYPNWPADAQLAALSKSWACGEHFEPHWPKLTAALQAGDFATAAIECHPSDQQMKRQNVSYRQRIDAEVVLFESACVVTANTTLNPDSLYWPRDLRAEADDPAKAWGCP